MSSRDKKRKFVTAAGCVVYRVLPEDVHVLLIKPRKESDAWGIPKGRRDPDDKTLIDCAIRETYEETGLACMPAEKLTPVFTKNPREIKKVHAYLARHMGDPTPNPITVDEVDDIQWFSIKQLPRMHRYQVPLMDEAILVLHAVIRAEADT